MPTTSLPHILHNEETRDHTFDYIFHPWLKRLLLNLSDYLIWTFSQSFAICNVHLCIIININLSLSLYHCREYKQTFQIINSWWLKYYFSLFPQNTGNIVNEKVKKTILLFSCPNHHNRPFITPDFLWGNWENVMITSQVWSQLSLM